MKKGELIILWAGDSTEKTGDSTTQFSPNQVEVVLTEKETGEGKLKTSEEGYGHNELEIMKRQLVSLLRGAPILYLIVCGILAILILLEFLSKLLR